MVINKIKNGSEFFDLLSSLPSGLMREAMRFTKRNTLDVVQTGKKAMSAVCPRCLKAHLMKAAREKDMDKVLVQILVDMGEHSIGHNGYYMDKEKVIKI